MLTTKSREGRERNKTLERTHPVKVTAFQYIREALLEERYEEMKELVEIAKDFGADYWELRKVLTRSEDWKGE